MADDELLEELIHAGNLVKNAGYINAARILGREGQKLLSERKHPRKQQLIEVRLVHGGKKAWLPKDRVRDAEEYDE